MKTALSLHVSYHTIYISIIKDGKDKAFVIRRACIIR